MHEHDNPGGIGGIERLRRLFPEEATTGVEPV
jgi:hypothetical protein